MKAWKNFVRKAIGYRFLSSTEKLLECSGGRLRGRDTLSAKPEQWSSAESNEYKELHPESHFLPAAKQELWRSVHLQLAVDHNRNGFPGPRPM